MGPGVGLNAAEQQPQRDDDSGRRAMWSWLVEAVGTQLQSTVGGEWREQR